MVWLQALRHNPAVRALLHMPALTGHEDTREETARLGPVPPFRALACASFSLALFAPRAIHEALCRCGQSTYEQSVSHGWRKEGKGGLLKPALPRHACASRMRIPTRMRMRISQAHVRRHGRGRRPHRELRGVLALLPWAR